jgi:1,4-dihydroxy-2-naphthoyl-CoA hydrolase
MSIWQRPIDLALIHARSLGTMAAHMGIEWTAVGDDFIEARMPVVATIKQPLGIMHGGASCVLAETVGSTAANFALPADQVAVGLDLNTNHIRAIREGYVIAKATPVHIGRQTQVWHIPILDEDGQIISLSRLTMLNLPRTHHDHQSHQASSK